MTGLSVTQVLTGGTLGLSSGIDDILVVEVGGRRVLYALNRAESTVIELSSSPEGNLSIANSLSLVGPLSAGTEPQLALVTGSSGTVLTVAGLAPASGQVVSLSATGELGNQQTLSGLGELKQANGFIAGSTSVIVMAGSSGGLAHFAESGSGYKAGLGLTDGADSYLADVTAITGFSQAGIAYVATASGVESGVNIAAVTESGLVQTGSLGAADSLPIGAPSDLATVARLNETLLLVVAQGTSSLSVLSVANGVPDLRDHIYDAADTQFRGVTTVSAVTSGDFAYAVAGGNEGGVSLFTILPGGRLLHLDSVAEDETVPLESVAAVEAFVQSNVLSIVVGSESETGLTRLAYDLSSNGAVVLADTDAQGATGTAFDDQLIGSVVGEPLSGLNGNDILQDGRGNDILTGGEGADIFVMTADGQTDQITDFEPGVDRLDLSAFDFLYDAAQLAITPTAIGATVSFGNETIFITSADEAPLTATDFPISSVLNVDRPPFLLVGREIVGTGADDVLNGGPGNDTIAGSGGNDSMFGDAGLDVLSGSLGEDTISGGNERDTLVGGGGNDLLLGGDGGDLIYGDDWA